MMLLFIGSFTGHGSQGISVAGFDPSTGTVLEPALAIHADNPSFLAKHPTLPVLYAVNEVGGSSGGSVSAYAMEASGLRLLGNVPSGGHSPCHLEVDPTGRMLVVAHYGGSGVTSFLLDAAGIPKLVSNLAQTGSSVNPERQKESHPHSANFSPDGRSVFVPDLGADRIFIYRADPKTGTLEPAGSVVTHPGSGPRHLVFRPDGAVMFVAHELSNQVDVFQRKADEWALKQTISTLPEGFAGKNTVAEIALHPSGKFLYVSNRGADTVAAFRVSDGAALEQIGQFSTRGKTPRHFAIDPSGRWLLAANQDDNSIVTFAIDGETGVLSARGEPVKSFSPVCLLFSPGKE